MQVLLSIPFRTSHETRKTVSIISQILPLIFQVLKAVVRIHAMKVNKANGFKSEFYRREKEEKTFLIFKQEFYWE